MKKDELNDLLRDYVRNNLSPRADEQKLISDIYNSIQVVLGQNCIQIGSYPRLTSITPVHDLDILYISGNFDPNNINPKVVLDDLGKKIEQELENITPYDINISLQTHSITIVFTDNDEEVISVDIVPAFISGSKNEFGDDIYWVPELIEMNHIKRIKYYEKVEKAAAANEVDWWIKSDPRGYISVAEGVNAQNPDFRKTVKFVKKWKDNLEQKDESLRLKSFHVEQIITNYFKDNPGLEIFDAIFKFFVELPFVVKQPNTISDRANNDKFIDDYLEEFTQDQIEKIIKATDGFLKKLEEIAEEDLIGTLMDISFYERKSISEAFLFDSGIPVLKEQTLTINGWIQKNNLNFRKLNYQGIIDRGLKIKFEVFMPISCDLYKWKVKNDDSSIQPRGEITDHHTLNDPEDTKYVGNHYVECYAILNNVCIASARQNVTILR